MPHSQIETKSTDRHGMVHSDEISGFFKELARGLTEENIPQIKRCWAVPSFVLGDNMSVVVKSSAELDKFFLGTKEQYNRMGIDEAIPEIENIVWLTTKIAQVQVTWPYIDKSGKKIGEESSCYTIKRENGSFRIHAVVMQGQKKNDVRFETNLNS